MQASHSIDITNLPSGAGRDTRLDFLRTVATVFVLIIHSASLYARSDAEGLMASWADTFSRPCISIFLFVSGFMFQCEDFHQLVKKFKRILVPYVIFSCFAIFYENRSALLVYLEEHPLDLLFRFLTCSTFEIYWFVLVILWCYVLGYLALNRRFEPLRALWIFTGFFLVSNLLHAGYYLEFLKKFGLVDSWFSKFYNHRLLLSWPFYFFLGLLLQRASLPGLLQPNRRLVITAWASIFILYNLFFFFSFNNIFGYFSVIGTVYAVSLILFLLSFQPKWRFFQTIGAMSYFVYLAHPFFVYFLRGLGKHLQIEWPFWFSIISFGVSFGGSVGLCLAAKRVLGKHSFLLVGA